MHWFLLVVAASMADEENLQLLTRAPLTRLPTCDVFLAPSTIPGSVCMRTHTHTHTHTHIIYLFIDSKPMSFHVLCELLLFIYFILNYLVASVQELCM